MDYTVDSNIIVVRGSNDILNSAYLSPINDGKFEFPSVEHFCQFQILFRAGFVQEAQETLDVVDSRMCSQFVRNLIFDRFGENGGDRFYNEIKDENLRKGLRLRLIQDHSFRRALLDTGRALLANCDVDDFRYGLGMDERQFSNWAESNQLKTELLLNWFRRYDLCPFKEILGQNKLGLILMDIRADDVERFRRSTPPPPPLPLVQQQSASISLQSQTRLNQPSKNQSYRSQEILATPKQLSQAEIEELNYQRYVVKEEGDQEIDWIVSDQILSLEGPFALLSQYYPTPFRTRKRRYRSVEHYAYQKFFRKLKLGKKSMEKLVTTPDPSKLSRVAKRILDEYWKKDDGVKKEQGEKDEDENHFYDQLLEYYERATKLKFDQYPILKRLLVSTGDSLLIETCPTTDRRATREWTINSTEIDLQRFLSTSPYNTSDLLVFLLKKKSNDDDHRQHGDKKRKKFFRYFNNNGLILGRNRAGLALMRLRSEYRRANVEILHPPAPPQTGGELDENRLTCFTNRSIFHPDYVAPFWTKDGRLYTSVQHFLSTEAAKKFEFPEKIQNQLLDCDARDVDRLLIFEIYQRFPRPEKYLEWYWSGGREEILKTGNRLKFEKNPDLLRSLLETGNSLMVYCRNRYESEETEFSIGSSEQDLKQWMLECQCDCRGLLKLCLGPIDRRPAFLGGNRLGALLMELRREFRLRGFQSHTLPKLGLPAEVILGVGCENEMDDGAEIGGGADIVWPSPHFLLSKKRGQPILDRASKKRKLNDYPIQSSLNAPPPPPAPVVALMDVEQLKQTAAMLATKLSAMRKQTEWEGETLKTLLDDLREIRDRVPQIDQSSSSLDDSFKSSSTFASTIEQPPPKPAPSASEQKEKWLAFESGLLSILRKAAWKTAKEEKEDEREEKSLFDSRNWDESRVRPLVDRVWPHLTIRERHTASEWLWYAIGKLETMRRCQKLRETKKSQEIENGGKFEFGAKFEISGKFKSLVPGDGESTTTKWVMPQIEVVMTQKSNEANEGARAGTPQGEGTTIDARKYGVDWILPEAGAYPKILAPVTP